MREHLRSFYQVGSLFLSMRFHVKHKTNPSRVHINSYGWKLSRGHSSVHMIKSSLLRSSHNSQSFWILYIGLDPNTAIFPIVKPQLGSYSKHFSVIVFAPFLFCSVATKTVREMSETFYSKLGIDLVRKSPNYCEDVNKRNGDDRWLSGFLSEGFPLLALDYVKRLVLWEYVDMGSFNRRECVGGHSSIRANSNQR